MADLAERPVRPTSLALIVLLTLACCGSTVATGAPIQTKAEVELSKLRAERDKARAETRKIARDNNGLWRLLGILAPMATALIAAGALVVTVKKNLDDREQEREARRATEHSAALQRKQDREVQSATETAAAVRRFDERFEAAAAAAAGDRVAQRRAGAVLLGSMTQGPGELPDQAINLLLALLQLEEAETDAGTTRLLVRALERALKVPSGAPPVAERFTLTHLRAPGVNLSGLDLTGVDLAFSVLESADLRSSILEKSRAVELKLPKAQLQHARLSHCEWFRLHAPGAAFQDATLVGSELREAVLPRADFFKAKLVGADLRGATLDGAKFQQSDLDGARLRPARIDDGALATVVKAHNWRSAEWDDVVRVRLEQIDAAQRSE